MHIWQQPPIPHTNIRIFIGMKKKFSLKIAYQLKMLTLNELVEDMQTFAPQARCKKSQSEHTTKPNAVFE